MDPGDTVLSLLKNSRYLHLATCSDDTPHVSLMYYTFFPADPAHPFERDDHIIMTSTKDSRKSANISRNPKVSVLLHDWVSAKSPADSSLVEFMRNLNRSALSAHSVALDGVATVETAPAAEFYKHKHLQATPADAHCFIDCPEALVIKVKLQKAKVADTSNNTYDWQ